MKRILVLGSTGSIGRQTLRVVERFAEEFTVIGLGAGRNARLLAEQIVRFDVGYAWVQDPPTARSLGQILREKGYGQCVIAHGSDEIENFLDESKPDVVVCAISGHTGLYPTYCAAERGLDIALANKESLVMMGMFLMELMKRRGGRLTPIDSEHSAIMQCLAGEPIDSVRRIVLTASGGPFRRDTVEQLRARSFAETQRHPVWKMGEKINVDSATMMNKGLEVIEACILFGQPPEKVDVLIHPECIVHSMVEFTDGSWKAQLGVPNMELPLLYALSTPRRLSWDAHILPMDQLGELHFRRVDRGRFRCLEIAYEAARMGGSMPTVLCVADEVAIKYFRAGQIGFMEIPEVIERTMQRHEVVPINSLEVILEVKRWATEIAEAEAKLVAEGS